MKKYWFCEKPAIMVEAEKAQRKTHPVWIILLYIVFTMPVGYWLARTALANIDIPNMGTIARYMAFKDFYLLIPAFLFILFALFVEKRSLTSLGIRKNHAFKRFIIWVLYIIGALILLSGISTIILYNYAPAEFDEGLPFMIYIPQFAVGEIVYALCKSIIIYGFVLISLANRMKFSYALLCVCVLFPLLLLFINLYFPVKGLPETPYLIIDTICIIFLGFLLSLIFLRTNTIWPTAAMSAIGSIVLRYILPSDNILNGGIYVLLMSALIYAVLFWPKKLTENQEGAGLVSQ